MRRRVIAQKTIDALASVLFLVSIVCIAGQYGSLECDVIGIKQFIYRTGIGLAVLGTGTLLSNIRLEGG